MLVVFIRGTTCKDTQPEKTPFIPLVLVAPEKSISGTVDKLTQPLNIPFAAVDFDVFNAGTSVKAVQP